MKAANVYQLDLFDKKTPIETVIIQPTKGMTLEVYKKLWHIAYFMELMDRLPDGRVLWDDERSDFFSDTAAESEYIAMQNGWFSMPMELPKELVDKMDADENQAP